MNNHRTVFTTVLTALLLCVTGSTVYAQAIVRKPVPSTYSFSSENEAPGGVSITPFKKVQLFLPASEISFAPGTVIRSVGFSYEGGADVPAGGNLKIYLENTSSTVNAKSTNWATSLGGMSTVYNGSYSVPVGILNEAEQSVNLTSSFTYTGGGLYVSYEYAPTSFSTIAARARVNTVSDNSCKMSSGTDLSGTTVGNHNYRPQILFGIDNPVNNDLEVRSISSFAIAGKALNCPNQVTAVVRNNSNQEHSNIQVTMTVSGVNTGSFTENIGYIAAGDSAEVSFVAPVTHNGIQHFIVSLPADEVNSNNYSNYAQQLDCETLSYVSDQFGYDSVGYGAGTGIMAVKYPVSQVAVRLDAVRFRVSRDAGNIGQSVRAVIIDEYSNILVSSQPFVMQASMLGTDQLIPLDAPVVLQPGESFYAGIIQEGGNNYPVGTAFPKKMQPGRSNSFFFDITGATSTEATLNGSFMIGVHGTPYLELAGTSSGQIMDGTQVMFVASPGFTNYDFKVNGVSGYSGVNNYFIYYPSNGDIITLETEINNCTYTATENFVMDVSPITPGAGNILYVNRHAAVPGDGHSWDAPLTELADALRWAKVREANFSPANPLKIFVAGGTYKPLYSIVDEAFGMEGGANNAFLLVKNVELYGGFAGTETSIAERDLSVAYHKTILSGDFSDDDMVTGDAQSLEIANMFENALHVVVASGEASNGIMDGFTIVGGGGELTGLEYESINGNQVATRSGSAIYIESSSPQIRNMVIAGNRSEINGAGIYAKNSHAAITNMLLFKNLSVTTGAAIYNDENADIYYTNLTITNNRSLTGSVITNNHASPQFRNSLVQGNNTGIFNISSTPVIRYSLVQGMAADAANFILDGTMDPQFTDVPGDDYTLKSSSSMINRGNNLYFQAGQTPDLTAITRDLNSKDRIQENTIDIGAYEAKPSLMILQHPVDVTSCQGSEVNFVALVNSSGISTPSYQWQQSNDGNTWNNIDGATQASYLLKASTEMYFRCIIGIPGFSITTNAAKLSTIPFTAPVITMSERYCLSDNTVELKASPEGGVFEGEGVSENSWSLLGFKTGKQTIRYKYTAPNGCQGTAEKTVMLESCLKDGQVKVLRAHPNPTRGPLTVLIEMGHEVREAEMHISTIHGQIVIRRQLKLARGTNIQEFDCSGLGAGIYFVIIYNESKKPLASMRFVKQ
ncbi:MAG: T9SS type A sorting domain-containing protein [Pseudobacter sp.]|uniref:T9SS type A sorting domain-containing protein n=1 Tax=Pseudobacter sp. TaxID=2045420 RepID=UPI003F80B350